MKKRIIVSLILLMLAVTACTQSKSETFEDSIPLMSFDKFKDIDINKVKSIDFIKYTEAGRDDENITDASRIQNIYNNLSVLRVGKEVSTACEDNTEVYVFNMDDDTKITIEIECDWLVLNNKRYEVK